MLKKLLLLLLLLPTSAFAFDPIPECARDGAHALTYDATNHRTFCSAISGAGGGAALAVGTSSVTGTTDKFILYNNAGTLGAYGITGSGTTAVLSTSPTFTTGITISAGSIITDTTTGLKIGTGTTQKLGFFNATPVVQQTGNVCTALQNLGLVTSCTPGGVSSFTGDGALVTNSASTGAVTVTLGTAPAGSIWGNSTGTGGAPAYSTDLYISGSGVFDGNFISHGTLGNSANGALSTPVAYYIGTPVTSGGNGITTAPLMLFQPFGTTAPSTWSTAGTFIGLNAESGFTGNLLDFHYAGGSSVLSIGTSGAITTAAGITAGGDVALSTHNITMTGSLGATGARLTKGWFTDLQVTNAIAGSITGNAATATALATPRAINGTNFDGTAAITITAAGSTLTGTSLASGITSSSLTSFGSGIALGTPASGTLTNATGLPISGLVNIGSNSMLGNWGATSGAVTANTIPACAADGSHALTYTNGTGILCTGVTGGGGTSIAIGTTVVAGGTTTRVLYDNGGVAGEYAITGTGNVVMSASPTLTGTVTGAAATWSGVDTALNFTATGTSADTIPVGTDGARPAGAVGQVRYNNTANTKGWLEAWSGLGTAAWVVLQPLVGGGLETTNSASTNGTNLQAQINSLITLGTTTLSTSWGIPSISVPRGSYPISSTISMPPWIKLKTSGTTKFDFSSASPTTGATNAGTAAGTTPGTNDTLHFASTPAGCVVGAILLNSTHSASLPANTQIKSKTGTTIVMTGFVTGTAVSSGDTISCSFQGMIVNNDNVPTNDFTNWENSSNGTPFLNTADGSLLLNGPGAGNSIGLFMGSQAASPTADQNTRDSKIGYTSILNFNTGIMLHANSLYIDHFDYGGHIGGSACTNGIATSQGGSNNNSGENIHFSGGWVIDGCTNAWYFDTPNIDTVSDGDSFDFNTTLATSTVNDGFARHSFLNGHIEEMTNLVACPATNTSGDLPTYHFINEKWVTGSAAGTPAVMFKGACNVTIDTLYISGYDNFSNSPTNLFMMDANVVPIEIKNIHWQTFGFQQLISQKLIANDDACMSAGVNTADLNSAPPATYSTTVTNTGFSANTGITATISNSVVWTTGFCSTSKSMKFTETNTTNSQTVVGDKFPVEPGRTISMDVVWQTTKATSTAQLFDAFLWIPCNPALTPTAEGAFGDTLGTTQASANTWSKMAYVNTAIVPAGVCYAAPIINLSGLAATEIVYVGAIAVNKE